jgi:NADPH:quinone reductase-like Zn-dependent oxidoreductase
VSLFPLQHINAGEEVFGSFGVDVLLKYNGVLAEYIVVPADELSI